MWVVAIFCTFAEGGRGRFFRGRGHKWEAGRIPWKLSHSSPFKTGSVMGEFQVQGQGAGSTSLFFQKDGSIKGCFTICLLFPCWNWSTHCWKSMINLIKCKTKLTEDSRQQHQQHCPRVWGPRWNQMPQGSSLQPSAPHVMTRKAERTPTDPVKRKEVKKEKHP